MEKRKTNIFKRLLTSMMSFALIFTVVNAQSPIEVPVDSSLFEEVETIAEDSIPNYYLVLEQEVLQKKDAELDALNKAAQIESDSIGMQAAMEVVDKLNEAAKAEALEINEAAEAEAKAINDQAQIWLNQIS